MPTTKTVRPTSDKIIGKVDLLINLPKKIKINIEISKNIAALLFDKIKPMKGKIK